VAVWIVDARGQTVAINEPATRLWTGNAPVPDEMGHYGAYKLYDPETGQELPVEERPLERAIAHGEVTSGRRYGMQRLDGSTGVILAFAGPIQTEDGETLGGVVIDLDITEQNRLEKINQEQKRELERSNRDLQDFASIISHDLKEPLRKITGFGELLTRRHRDSLDEEGRDYVERMVNAAERMQRMIDDMLEYSRVDTRGRPFEPVDLNQVTNEVLEDLDMRIEQTGGHVTVDPLPTIQADPGQMKHLLQNLIGNALKFHRPDTPPEVRVQARALNGREVELTVSDNGIGFDEESLGKLFMPFVRLHGRGEYEGSGMGLAICRRIAERHGGSITARSQPGQGSTFIVVLPKQPPKK
jgi:signal transduction histidine kinase